MSKLTSYLRPQACLRSNLLTRSYRELAELLGQVKPPTATKDEIDKSGLQIIKGSDLKRLEKDGRVASNCVERVRDLVVIVMGCVLMFVTSFSASSAWTTMTPRTTCASCHVDIRSTKIASISGCR